MAINRAELKKQYENFFNLLDESNAIHYDTSSGGTPYFIDDDGYVRINGDLYMEGAQDITFPPYVAIYGELHAKNADIDFNECNSLYADGYIDLQNAQAIFLPTRVTTREDMNIAGSDIIQLPNYLDVGGNFVATGMQNFISGDTCSHLYTGGNLILQDIVSGFPEHMDVGGDFSLSRNKYPSRHDLMTDPMYTPQFVSHAGINIHGESYIFEYDVDTGIEPEWSAIQYDGSERMANIPIFPIERMDENNKYYGLKNLADVYESMSLPSASMTLGELNTFLQSKGYRVQSSYIEQNISMGDIVQEENIELFSDNPEVIRITDYLDAHGAHEEADKIREALAEFDTVAFLQNKFGSNINTMETNVQQVSQQVTQQVAQKEQSGYYIVHDAKLAIRSAKEAFQAIGTKLTNLRAAFIHKVKQFGKEVELFGLTKKSNFIDSIQNKYLNVLHGIKEEIADRQMMLTDVKDILLMSKENAIQAKQETEMLSNLADNRQAEWVMNYRANAIDKQMHNDDRRIDNVERQQEALSKLGNHVNGKIDNVESSQQQRHEKIENLKKELDSSKNLNDWIKDASKTTGEFSTPGTDAKDFDMVQ